MDFSTTAVGARWALVPSISFIVVVPLVWLSKLAGGGGGMAGMRPD
jgi:hypothetical protein